MKFCMGVFSAKSTAADRAFRRTTATNGAAAVDEPRALKTGILAAIAVLVVLDAVYAGIGKIPFVQFLWVYMAEHPDALTNDYACNFLRETFPWVINFIGPWLYVPLYHFYLGLLIKMALFYAYYSVVRRSMQSEDVAFISLVFMLAFSQFGWHEFRGPIYLSYRQIFLIFGVVGLGFFLSEAFFFAALFFGLGAQFQGLYALNIVLPCSGVLLYRRVFHTQSKVTWKAVALFPLIFLFLFSLGHFGQMEATEAEEGLVDAATWWKISYLIEPDDQSIRYWWEIDGNNRIWNAVGFLILTSGIHFFLKRSFPSSYDGNWILLLWGSWVILFIGLALEYSIDFLPSAFIDLFALVQLRRQLSFHSLFVMPVLAFATWETLRSIGTRFQVPWIQSALNRKWLVWGGILAICVAKVVGERDLAPFLDRVRSMQTLEAKDFRFYERRQDLGFGLDRDLYYEALEWIRDQTEDSAGSFAPPYITEFRVLAHRACFLTEGVDGGSSIYSRPLATVFYARVRDLLRDGGEEDVIPYLSNDISRVRDLYLSNTTASFRRLNEKYRDYGYVLTEIDHHLDFEVVFRNKQFVIYRITGD